MEESMTEVVLKLYRLGKWKEIVEKYHDHKDRNKLLWVFPSEDNFEFLKECLKEFKCKGVASVGCGSGLLEWMLQKATGSKEFYFIYSPYIYELVFLLYLETYFTILSSVFVLNATHIN